MWDDLRGRQLPVYPSGLDEICLRDASYMNFDRQSIDHLANRPFLLSPLQPCGQRGQDWSERQAFIFLRRPPIGKSRWMRPGYGTGHRHVPV